MPLPTIPSGNVASALPTGYEIANSCRFNSADSAKMAITFSGAGTSLRKATFSFWIKRSNLTVDEELLYRISSGSDYFNIAFSDTDTLKIKQSISSSVNLEFISNAVYRDPSAWMHLLVVFDTTQSTEGNRVKIYVNGTQVTSWSTSTYPGQNTDMLFGAANANTIASSGGGNYFDGYLAEVCYCDGQSLTPTSFGEFDEDTPSVFKPIDVSGLTFGTNGFYLDFEDSSNLGNDANGGTDLTETNLAAVDQATDTPTNNFCTMNPLYAATSSAFTFAQGNCELTQNDTNWRTAAGTMGVSSGKWYFECKGGRGTAGYTHYGWASTSWLNEKGDGSMNEPGTNHNGPCVTYYGSNGNNYYSTSSTTGSNGSYGDSWDNDHTIGCFLDLDNNKAYWSKDGTLQNSGTGYSIESGYTWLPVVGGYDMDGGSGESVKVNFGGCPATTISSGNTDGDYGNFEYTTTITGDGSSKTFKALCTKNLAEFG